MAAPVLDIVGQISWLDVHFSIKAAHVLDGKLAEPCCSEKGSGEACVDCCVEWVRQSQVCSDQDNVLDKQR